MPIPEYGQPGWHAQIDEYLNTADYRRTIENGLDPAHNEFVHTTHGFSGKEGDSRVPDLNIEEQPWGCGFMTTYYSPPLQDEKMKAAAGRQGDAVVTAGTFHHGPTCMTTRINPGPGFSIHQNVFKTPVDATTVRTFLVQTRSFLLEPQHDARFSERNLFVREQDQTVLTALEPFFTPETNNHELLMPSDRAVARYRELLQQWEARGWRIDEAALARDRDRVARRSRAPRAVSSRRAGCSTRCRCCRARINGAAMSRFDRVGAPSGATRCRSRLKALLLALVIAGPAMAGTSIHRTSGAEPPSLDPTLGSGSMAAPMLSDMVEGLVGRGPSKKPEPASAESWTVSPDGLSWTFRLRPGLQWSDGTPLTAEDFVYSYRRLLDPASCRQQRRPVPRAPERPQDRPEADAPGRARRAGAGCPDGRDGARVSGAVLPADPDQYPGGAGAPARHREAGTRLDAAGLPGEQRPLRAGRARPAELREAREESPLPGRRRRCASTRCSGIPPRTLARPSAASGPGRWTWC